MISKENRFIGCWISAALFKKIEDYMQKNSFESKSELLRTLLREAIEKKRSKNEERP